ncbi:DUF4241 domain-containing protein [Streptomyces sp. NBRC 109706]|uniref:DUF4241 domain-containing protein n=1 Tax=Streptomyces sp. NBRC 109706 TaxID=1550035 RepID=UPI00078237DE|nr:DUF4241 domain-containing protein [Streptomyces sp. NBRC 109706]
MPLPAPDIARLFTLGSVFHGSRGETSTVNALPEAPLTLPSGRVAACDPLIGIEDGVEPFVDEVPPGTYPVVLSIVEVTEPDAPEFAHDRAAAAWLRISDEPAVRWSLALVAGQDTAGLSDEEWIGYGVDTGTGCFVDAMAAPQLTNLLGEDGDDLIDAIYGRDVPPPPLPSAVVDPRSGYGLVGFPTGWGDGAYPTWVGHDATGRVTGFVTSFFVADDPAADDPAADAPATDAPATDAGDQE